MKKTNHSRPNYIISSADYIFNNDALKGGLNSSVLHCLCTLLFLLLITKGIQSWSLNGVLHMNSILANVMTQQHWSSASFWPALCGSDWGTGPSARSHTASRTSWCRKDCSPLPRTHTCCTGCRLSPK